MINSGVYQIQNKKNGKRYIGSAVDVSKRWYNHRSELRNDKHPNRYFQNAWNKYGEDAFEFVLILECDVEDLIWIEQVYFDAVRPEYNLCLVAGSPLGVKHTDEARANMSRAMMGNTNALGYKHTDEAKAKISKAFMGKKLSPEHIANLKGFLGRKHSEETKAKMSISAKRRQNER